LIAAAILAFFLGVIVQEKIGRDVPAVRILESAMMWLLVPFFFISMGLNIEPLSILANPFMIMLIVSIAVIGKIVGTFMVKPFTKFTWKQLYLIGWGMNSRGAVELAIALIAFKTGLITPDIYTGLVIMAVLTTILFPFIISILIKKNPKIMD